MKVRKENCEWLKNILLPTKKASKVNKDILYRQQVKKEKKKCFLNFNAYELKCKNHQKLVNVSKYENNIKIFKNNLGNRSLILACLVSKWKPEFWNIKGNAEKADEFNEAAWTGK